VPAGKRRHALTMARRPAPIDIWGDPSVGRALSRALDVSQTGEDALHRYTHGFHVYPARMHPLTARRALGLLGLGPGALVLDPFCGSGTVLVEAMLAGARAVGVDAGPIAKLVAHAKTRLVSASARRELVTAARRLAALVVAEGKAARRAGYEAPGPRAFPDVDPVKREERLRGWFDPHVRRELEALAATIAREKDPGLRAILEAILSSILIKMSRRSSDTSGEPVARRLARGMAARLFAERAELLAAGLGALADDVPPGTPAAEVRAGDARALEKAGIIPGSVAGVVSSPPYAGTYDYVDHHALRMWFLGLPQAGLDDAEIGARRHFHGPAAAVATALVGWERAFLKTLGEISRALAPGGRAALLVGDSLAGMGLASRAVFIDDVIGRLAPRADLALVAAASQARVALGTWEQRAFADRPKREHLVLLERPRE
jgi:SAM-dependent methyltransferase